MHIDVYVHLVDDNPLLKLIYDKVAHMALDLTKLTTAVAAQKTVLDSAVVYIQGVPALVAAAVKQALIDAGIDTTTAQATADAAAAEIQQETDAVQAAMVANTTPPAPVTP